MKSQDRKALIRLASSLPKGSEERKAILTGLKRTKTPLVGSRRVGAVRFTLDADLPKGVERSFSRDLLKMIDANMWDYGKHNDAGRMAGWIEQEAWSMLTTALERSGLSEDEADNAMEDAWDGVKESIGEYLRDSYEEAADQAEDDEPDMAENYRDDMEVIEGVFRVATSSMSDRKALIRLASSLPKGSEERKAILTGLQKQGVNRKDQKIYVGRWNDTGNYDWLEAAGLDDAYDELYALTQKEQKLDERGKRLPARDSKRYVELWEMLKRLGVDIRFGVEI